MRGLRKYLTPFAPDQSGAVSVLYELGGIVVVCDAGGCTGNICGFDEPRWHHARSAVFSAGLRDMDAILGRDDKLVAELADAAHKIEANFAAIVGTPVPSVIGTDYHALRRMAERRCDLPVITVDTTGMELYDVGASKAYVELFDRFATRSLPQQQGRTLYLGANPLDLSCVPPRSMSLSFDDVVRASEAEKVVVVAPSGLAAAKLLRRRFGAPYEITYPWFDEDDCLSVAMRENRPGANDSPHDGHDDVMWAGKRVLVVHQQVAANTLRTRLLAHGAERVTCATWFMQVAELAQDGDVRLREEDDFEELVYQGDFDVLVGDPTLWRIVPRFEGATIGVPQFPVSGELAPWTGELA
jgi:hypothetical protein